MECLSELTIVGEISQDIFQGKDNCLKFQKSRNFVDRFNYMKEREDSFFPHVIVDSEDQIAAAGTLFIERKFIHNCGRVGHVEDIVVSSRHRGKNLGRFLLQRLIELAQREGCYKIILDCQPEMVQFYEKCGFTEKGRQMALYFKE